MKSDWKEADGTAGEFTHTAGKWYGDEKADKGLQTGPDARFYSISADMGKTVSNEGKTLVVQVRVFGSGGLMHHTTQQLTRRPPSRSVGMFFGFLAKIVDVISVLLCCFHSHFTQHVMALPNCGEWLAVPVASPAPSLSWLCRYFCRAVFALTPKLNPLSDRFLPPPFPKNHNSSPPSTSRSWTAAAGTSS